VFVLQVFGDAGEAKPGSEDGELRIANGKQKRLGVIGRTLFFLALAVVALSDAADGKILVEIGPVKAEGGKLDVVQLGRGGVSQTRILRDGKTELRAAL
jgi:hypothetical protein